MSQLLVRVISKFGKDPYKDAQQSKRGDVIVVKESGLAWGAIELSLPEYRIIDAPKSSISSLSMLTEPEAPTTRIPDPMLQHRGFYLNLDDPSMDPALQAYLADDSRVQPIFTVNEPGIITGLITKRPKLPNPHVIG